ncbi:hypothetical protein MKL01_06310, partial [Methylobacterium sp. J-070]|nr:hypothetical protein [Methylobacterium sp. J-070]
MDWRVGIAGPYDRTNDGLLARGLEADTGRRRIVRSGGAATGARGLAGTTLLSVSTRLYTNQPGRVSIFGHALDREPSRALARLGVVFQARTL